MMEPINERHYKLYKGLIYSIRDKEPGVRIPVTLANFNDACAAQQQVIDRDIIKLGVDGAHRKHHIGVSVNMSTCELTTIRLSEGQKAQIMKHTGATTAPWWTFSSYRAFTIWMAERLLHSGRERSRRWRLKHRKQTKR